MSKLAPRIVIQWITRSAPTRLMALAALLFGGCATDGATTSQVGLLVTATAAPELVADGASRIPVRITITGDVPPQPTVALSASDGLFTASGRKTLALAFGRTSEQYVELQAPRAAGIVTIRAGLGLESTSESLELRSALADTLLLEPKEGFIIDSTMIGKFALVATLRRTRGMPSPGAMVTFSDSPPAGAHGVFSTAPPSDSLGRVEVRYSPGIIDSSGRGPRRITACTLAVTSQPTCGSTVIFVK